MKSKDSELFSASIMAPEIKSGILRFTSSVYPIKVWPVEDKMTEGDIWAWNLLRGIGNDIY